MGNERNRALDAIKVIATVIIVFHHYQQVFNVFFENRINYFGGWFYFGFLVELFFCISGFLMARYVPKIAAGELRFPDYFFRRYLRIIPVMAISVVSTSVLLVIHEGVIGMRYMDTIPSVWGTIIASLGIQAGWGFENPTINNPIWYVSILLFCYIAFYFISWLSARHRVSPVYGFALMVFLGVGVWEADSSLPFLTYGMCRGYYAFFWGVLLCMILDWPAIRAKINVLAAVSLGVLAYLTWLLANHRPEAEWNLRFTMTFVYYSALIILAQAPLVRRLFGWRIVELLGRISFNAYVWHGGMYTLLIILAHALKLNIDYGRHFVMYGFAAGCFVVGTLSYYLLERPINRGIDALRRRRSIPQREG